VRLRTKLLLAQLPLVIALGVTIVVGSAVTRALARGSEDILKDNYRSVLAAERMKEAAERIDSGVVFAVIGRAARGLEQIDANLPKFDDELRAQEGNITEIGEHDATVKLRAAWTAYRAMIAEVRKSTDASGLDERYFSTLLPEFLAVKDAADAILALNQDAMIQKSDRAQRLAGRWSTLLVVVSIAGLVLGLVASSIMTSRVLRPLGVLGQTARRLGEGDVAVRARVDSGDEIGALARELNTMAARIQKYRQSSLGELLEAQLAAQATIDSLPDPVLVVALDGELRHANQAAEAVLKARAEAGASGLAKLDPAIRSVVERMRQHIAAGHGAYVPKGLEEAVKIATGDGERVLLPRAAPLYAEEGDVVGATIVFQDVTRLHRFEELRNNLVATVAHELRTPLTSLRMAVHLLAEQAVGPLTPKQGDLVFAAREECDRLQSIVDELLDLSRIQADRIELRLADHDPEELVREAIEAQRSAAAAREVQLRSELLPDTRQVTADRERILLVLANLIGNAIRYGPAGGTATIRALLQDGVLRVEVSDQGAGVPAEYQQAIFDKYVRVPGASPGGAGLGLFIASEIVHAHGGEIGVAGEPGQGATFWFTVRLARSADPDGHRG
jgi:signal transduction histidine kinase